MKSLKEISLTMTDEEYYNDGTIHHSILSSFSKGGFDSLPTLFEHKESPSLLLGSIVDTLLTDSIEVFNEKYLVADFPAISTDIVNVIKGLFNLYSNVYSSLDEISDSIISNAMLSAGLYNNNWGAAARAKRCREGGTEYYNLLYVSSGKTLVSSEMYTDALNMIRALKTSPTTAFFYQEDSDDNVERVYQPIFRETIDGITYTIKADELVVLHDKKKIIATDLKTTGKPEYKFAQSFIDWGYSQQSRLYYRVLKQALSKDEYFKDFEITNWFFIVVNKTALNPLVWEDTDTKTTGALYYGKNNQIEVKDPFDLAKELNYYLNNECKVPINIQNDKPNDIRQSLSSL